MNTVRLTSIALISQGGPLGETAQEGYNLTFTATGDNSNSWFYGNTSFTVSVRDASQYTVGKAYTLNLTEVADPSE